MPFTGPVIYLFVCLFIVVSRESFINAKTLTEFEYPSRDMWPYFICILFINLFFGLCVFISSCYAFLFIYTRLRSDVVLKIWSIWVLVGPIFLIKDWMGFKNNKFEFVFLKHNERMIKRRKDFWLRKGKKEKQKAITTIKGF